ADRQHEPQEHRYPGQPRHADQIGNGEDPPAPVGFTGHMFTSLTRQTLRDPPRFWSHRGGNLYAICRGDNAMDNKGLETLLAVTVVAALAPTIVSLLPRPRPPQVVVLIFCGIIIGPTVLGLGDTHSIRLLANVGLGFLFLLAGYELDPSLLRQHAGKLAIGGWLISALLAIVAAAGLTTVGFVRDYVPIGLALTTTALGTLLPILKDNDLLGGRFGRYVLAAGAAGELFPILVIS